VSRAWHFEAIAQPRVRRLRHGGGTIGQDGGAEKVGANLVAKDVARDRSDGHTAGLPRVDHRGHVAQVEGPRTHGERPR
jgi:hypothetical protein